MSTKTKVWIVLGLLGAGVAIGIIFANWRRNDQVVALQAHSDSVAVHAAQTDTAATRFADSTKHVIDSLQQSKAPRTIEINTDEEAEHTADSALAAAHTATDSVAALLRDRLALVDEVVKLKANAHTDSVSLAMALFRGDSLLNVVHNQTDSLVGLNKQIQQLNSHTLPKWARVGFEVLKVGLAVKGGFDMVHGR